MVNRLPTSPQTGYIRGGEQTFGSFIRASLNDGGCAGLRESALADVMIALRQGGLQMPQHPSRHAIPIVPLGQLGKHGLLSRDIGSKKAGSRPFEVRSGYIQSRECPTILPSGTMMRNVNEPCLFSPIAWGSCVPTARNKPLLSGKLPHGFILLSTFD